MVTVVDVSYSARGKGQQSQKGPQPSRLGFNIEHAFQDVLSCQTLQYDNVFSLTWKQRLYGLLVCVVLTAIIAGLVPMFCIILAYLCVVLQRFSSFILLYSIENVVALTAYGTASKPSTCFIVGPVTQFKSMFNPVRAITATVFLCSLVLTIFFALKVGRQCWSLGEADFVCGVHDNPNFVLYLVLALVSPAGPEAYPEATWCIAKPSLQALQQALGDWLFRRSLYGSKR